MHHREDNDWVVEVQGFLGIVDIMGVQHLMVIISKQEVAAIQHRFGPEPDTPGRIFELQEIELIPYRDVVSET